MGDKDLSFYNKTERPWRTRLDRTAIVGPTRASEAKIWFRMKSAGKYQLLSADFCLRNTSSQLPVE